MRNEERFKNVGTVTPIVIFLLKGLHLSFWKPIQILLHVRRQVARARLAANPTAALWTMLVILLLLLTALSVGAKIGAHWSELPRADAEEILDGLWLKMQAFWLLALLFPGGIALLGQIPPRSTLLPFGLRPLQIFVAEHAALLLDVPSVLACALTFPLICFQVGGGEWLEAAVTLLGFLSLGLQTGICARLLTALVALGARRFRRMALMPGLTAFLLLGLYSGMPPAFASLTSTASQNLLLPPLAVSSRFPAVHLAPLLPSRLAAHAVVAAQRGDFRGVLGFLGSMASCLFLTGGAALWALRSEERMWVASEGGAVIPVKARKPLPVARSQPGPFPEIVALVLTEWQLLLRTPQNYLPLRKPASLLLLGVFAFLAPDMGRNPIYNLEECLAIGILLYSVLWQVQFLCNRFGNEAGTGALLFGFSIARPRLLLGKNIALFGLLLAIDSPLLVGMAVVAEAPENIGLFLKWLPLILLMLTSLGNIVSVLHPFSILRQERHGGKEPPEMLSWAYVLVGGATFMMLIPIAALLSYGVPGWIGAAVVLGGLYAASLYGSSALLARREYRMIAATSHFDT